MEKIPSLKEIHLRSKALKKENAKFFRRLRNRKKSQLDHAIHALHDEAFSKIDCLECANCCKTTSPVFLERDIRRLAKFLGMKYNAFIEKYLRMDEEGDYVLLSAPCPFLEKDQTCLVYEVRPKACKDYPHTNRKQMHKFLSVTYHNVSICPAVFFIIERLKAGNEL